MHRIVKFMFILSVLIGLLIPAAFSQEIEMDDLRGTGWQLVSIEGETIHENSNITLYFDQEGNIGGSGGCNRYSGRYTVDEDGIIVEPIASTLMMCDDEEVVQQEQAYLEALSMISALQINENDELVISTGDGQELIFRPIPPVTDRIWELASLDGEAPLGDEPITLEFVDGQARGTGGCNQYRAGFTYNGEDLMISPIFSTRRACADEALTTQEANYFAELENAATLTVTEEQLIITTGEGVELIFNSGASLARTDWQLESIGGDELPEAVNITLQFGSTGGIGGSGGCNTYGGSYTTDGEQLTINEVFSTLMACADSDVMEFEQRYYEALRTATSYMQSDGQLILTYADGQQMIFTPAPQPEQ